MTAFVSAELRDKLEKSLHFNGVAAAALANRDPFGNDIDQLGRTRRQRTADLRKWIREDEQRLRALFSGAPADG